MARIDEKIKAFEDVFDVAPAPNVTAFWLAEQYAEAGIKVFPLRVDKIPCIEGWKTRGTTDLKQLEKWFLNSSFSKRAVMVGMHCGANGLVALDADRKPNKENGVDNLRNLYAELRIDPATQFPNLPITLSPSGSLHHIYKQPFEGGRIACSTGRLPAQIDVRGDGGLVALPGSVNGKGVYTTAPGAASLIDSFSRGSIPYLPQSLARIIGTKRGGATGAWSGEPLLPDDLLARILDALPNDTDYFGDRDKWVQFGFSVFAASGGEAREEWLQWCAKWDGGGDPDKDAHFWDTINSGDVRSRIGEIMRALDHFGLDDLAHDARMFEAADAFNDDIDEKVLMARELVNQRERENAPECELTEKDIAGVWFDGEETMRPTPMLIETILPARGLTFLGGQSGAGKSFVAIDIAVALATGQKFFGLDVEERVGVIYVAGEGAGTIAPRLAAAKKAREVKGPVAFAAPLLVPDLMNINQGKRFIESLRIIARRLEEQFGVRAGLVVVDTLGACFSMRDENSAAEMNTVCKAAAELGAALGAATLVVAHYGKAQETGIRGSSAIRGAGESVVAVLAERDELKGTCGNRRLVHLKSRTGEEGATFHFDLEHVPLGFDDKGRPFGAAKIVRTRKPAAAAAGSPKDALRRAFAQAYERLAEGVEETADQDGVIVRKVAVDAIREELRRAGFLERDAKGNISAAERKRLSRVREQLLIDKSFVQEDDLIWLCV